jgi:butyryl-CoA dehydrogenase
MFALSEEHQAIQETTSGFVKDVLLPSIRERDDAREDALEARATLMEMGFGGMTLAEDVGGLDLDSLSISLVLEEIARVDPALSLQLAWHNVWGLGLLQQSQSVSAKKLLTQAAAGETLLCWAGESDLDVVKEADAYVVHGRLTQRPALAAAGHLIFIATTQEKEGLFLLDMNQNNVTCESDEQSMCLHTAAWGKAQFENARAELLLPLDETPAALHSLRAMESLALGSIALGLLQGAFHLAKQYASEREQFGRRIDQFEAIRFKLGQMALDTVRLDALRMKAAWVLTEKGSRAAAQLCDMLRLDAALAAAEAGREGVQVHGGYGYSREYHAERYMRDARLLGSISGGLEVLGERIAARVIAD